MAKSHWKTIATFNQSQELTWQPFAALIEAQSESEETHTEISELEEATLYVADRILD